MGSQLEVGEADEGAVDEMVPIPSENQIIDRTRDAQNSASSVRSMAYFRIDRTQFSIDRSRRDVSLKLLLSQRAMERAVGRKNPRTTSLILIELHDDDAACRRAS